VQQSDLHCYLAVVNDHREWPTIPQLYVKGEFVGGCDIVTDQYKSGDLLDLLQQNKLVE